MVAQLIPERDFRGPGCTDACEVVKAIVPGRFGRSELLLHDPSVHEAYGRITGGPNGRTVVWTGPLVIDRWLRTATLYSERLDLTAREWDLLDFLASKPGGFCRTQEVAVATTGSAWQTEHTTRIHLARLRAKLGSSRDLIETRPGMGYRLVMLAPIEGQPGDRPTAPTRPWATQYARCVCCGTTNRPHEGHGRCSRCKGGARRYHVGPCGAPPLGSDGAP